MGAAFYCSLAILSNHQLTENSADTLSENVCGSDLTVNSTFKQTAPWKTSKIAVSLDYFSNFPLMRSPLPV